ncbi:hypothetical protein Nepgr_020919 [Nepenthes gracilis]|uniref:Uncharacterized protein n=1 Tax=Nepenthes gracilis TaxID=150966 RepID=A0AAD3XVN6_NEPGR|nr:hypothetical protein Nepgr_020919 [Nepenthes gracilis]
MRLAEAVWGLVSKGKLILMLPSVLLVLYPSYFATGSISAETNEGWHDYAWPGGLSNYIIGSETKLHQQAFTLLSLILL